LTVSELEIIDMHCHLYRSPEHGQEMRDYFLTPALVKPGASNLGTLEEFEELMDACGISSMNALMLTWSGRYYRHGAYTLPDDPDKLAAADLELRDRITQRVRENNDWAAFVARTNDRVTYFAGVNPVVMSAEGAAAEAEAQIAAGALGIKLSPGDIGAPGSDPRYFPLYEYCLSQDVPIITETGGHNPNVRPSGFNDALATYPDLQICFAHFGHDKQLGGPLDLEVLELAQKYERVYTDTSLRLNEVYDGTWTPQEMVSHLRALGIDRAMFGTNYVFSDLLNTRPGHVDAPDDIDPRFTQVWKSIDVLKKLPLTDDELAGVAAGNFRRFTGRTGG